MCILIIWVHETSDWVSASKERDRDREESKVRGARRRRELVEWKVYFFPIHHFIWLPTRQQQQQNPHFSPSILTNILLCRCFDPFASPIHQMTYI